MKRVVNLKTVFWLISAIIWGVIAWNSYLDEKFNWVWVQVAIMIGFILKFIYCFCKQIKKTN